LVAFKTFKFWKKTFQKILGHSYLIHRIKCVPLWQAETNRDYRRLKLHEGEKLVMQKHVFAFSLIIGGTTEKVLQFKMPLKSIYSKTLGLVTQKMYFWTLQRGSNNNKSGNWHYFCNEKNDFWAAPYRPMLVLHKVTVFYWLRGKSLAW
jgi:hypothetical protein